MVSTAEKIAAVTPMPTASVATMNSDTIGLRRTWRTAKCTACFIVSMSASPLEVIGGVHWMKRRSEGFARFPSQPRSLAPGCCVPHVCRVEKFVRITTLLPATKCRGGSDARTAGTTRCVLLADYRGVRRYDDPPRPAVVAAAAREQDTRGGRWPVGPNRGRRDGPRLTLRHLRPDELERRRHLFYPRDSPALGAGRLARRPDRLGCIHPGARPVRRLGVRRGVFELLG